MSGSSMNDIKSRIKSVDNTLQITKAMELVATSKLRRAKETAERTRPFYLSLKNGMSRVLAAFEGDTPYTEKREGKKTLWIVVAGDRGLCGGYNANIFKAVRALAGEEDVFLPIGKKACEYFAARKAPTPLGTCEYATDVGVGGSFKLATAITDGFLRGDVDRVCVICTHFASMLTQTVKTEQLLPLETASDVKNRPLTDGDPELMLQEIVPVYVGGVIYSCLCESAASEHGARRTAMSAANKNATEMIDDLHLSYNRARQAVITQEITEIVSGAEAL